MSYCKLGMVFHRKLLFDEFVVHFEKKGGGATMKLNDLANDINSAIY